MKEYNGIISEKTLQEISAGMNIDKEKLKHALIGAGVILSGAVPLTILTNVLSYKSGKKSGYDVSCNNSPDYERGYKDALSDKSKNVRRPMIRLDDSESDDE